MEEEKNYIIRHANSFDLDELTFVEASCFNEKEACGKEEMKRRLDTFADCFWLMTDPDNGKIIGYIGGMSSNEEILDDKMYADASLHNKDGIWQMIFSVCTLPEYRNSGYASYMMSEVIRESRERGKKGIILTCKKEYMHFYDRMGFVNEGDSDSVHGGAKWFQMRHIFNYNFFAALSRMKYIERWALMRNSRPENLSEHSSEVAMIAHALCTIGNVRYGKHLDANFAALIGIYHDASEIITGDMPTPVKYYSNDIKDAYKKVEHVAEKQLLSKLPSDMRQVYEAVFNKKEDENDIYMRKLVKAADKLSALIKCIEEENSGNREFRTAKMSVEHSLKKMQETLPEVRDFMNEFLPSYGHTLDELQN